MADTTTTTPPPEMIPKTEAIEAFAARDKAKEALREATAKLQMYEQAEAQRKAEIEAQQQEQERSKIRTLDEYKQAMQKQDEAWKSKLSERDKKAAEKLIPKAVRAAMAAVKDKIAPEAVEDLAELITLKHVGFDPETYDVYVKDKDGKPLKNDKLEPISLESFVAEQLEKKSYAKIDKMVTTTGVKPGGVAKTWTMEQVLADKTGKIRSEWLAADPAGFEAAKEAFFSPAAIAARAAAMFK